MSLDTVDDLLAAEEAAGSLAAALAALLEASPLPNTTSIPTEYGRARSGALALVSGWSQYCRPTCGAEGDAHSDACSDPTCGCPCGHTDEP